MATGDYLCLKRLCIAIMKMEFKMAKKKKPKTNKPKPTKGYGW